MNKHLTIRQHLTVFVPLLIAVWCIQYFIDNDGATCLMLAMGMGMGFPFVAYFQGVTNWQTVWMHFWICVALSALTYVLHFGMPDRFPLPILNVMAVFAVLPSLLVRWVYRKYSNKPTNI